MATGTATIDFGAIGTGGATSASVAVTGQAAILSGSFVEAWLSLAPTAEHSLDEIRSDPPRIFAGPPSAGVGFTIYAEANCIRTYGTFTVSWVWV